MGQVTWVESSLITKHACLYKGPQLLLLETPQLPLHSEIFTSGILAFPGIFNPSSCLSSLLLPRVRPRPPRDLIRLSGTPIRPPLRSSTFVKERPWPR